MDRWKGQRKKRPRPYSKRSRLAAKPSSTRPCNTPNPKGLPRIPQTIRGAAGQAFSPFKEASYSETRITRGQPGFVWIAHRGARLVAPTAGGECAAGRQGIPAARSYVLGFYHLACAAPRRGSLSWIMGSNQAFWPAISCRNDLGSRHP